MKQAVQGYREKIFLIIDNESKSTLKSQIFDSVIMFLIVLSILSIIVESFHTTSIKYHHELYLLELSTIVVFTVEYLLRIFTADLKYKSENLSYGQSVFRFITSSNGIVDLIAVLPFYVPFFVALDLRFIRIVKITRLLRVLKLGSLSSSIGTVSSILIEKKSELTLTLFVTFILLLVSSTIMFNLENEYQPEQFPNIIATFWWAIATLTTVGYGDVYPVTGWGRLVSGVIAVLGIGLVALPTGIISSAFIEQFSEKESETSIQSHSDCQALFGQAYAYCPYCGEKLN
jgi:voltage-gated potassium channel